MGARLIKATEQIIATIVRLFRWWFRQIGRQDSIRGKAIVACVGLLALCTVCSLPVALVNGPSTPRAAVAVAPSMRPTSVEVKVLPPVATKLPPTPIPSPSITVSPLPTATPEPILIRLRQTMNVRTGPGLDYPIIGKAYGPIEVEATGVRNEQGNYWYHIHANDVDGWVTVVGINPATIASLPVDTQTFIVPPTSTPPPTETPRPKPTPKPEPAFAPAPSNVRVGAICKDGTRSSATGRGACSHHGGVARWLYN
jgi:hypothetical protein